VNHGGISIASSGFMIVEAFSTGSEALYEALYAITAMQCSACSYLKKVASCNTELHEIRTHNTLQF
jgi:hypothetical protein